MQSLRWLAGCLAPLVLLIGTPAFAGCKKSLTLRETPGGGAEPAQIVECDESETPALLEPSAHLRLCDPEALEEAGVSFGDCARAVDGARVGLRQAKIRAALQKEEDSAAIVERYGASKGELETLRSSADLSGPMPAGVEAGEEAAQ